MEEKEKKEIEQIYPLSPMQEGMLYHYVLDPEGNQYFVQIVISMEGYLDMEMLEKSFNVILSRHEILRTVFIYESVDEPVQVVLKNRKLKVETIDVSDNGSDEKQLIEKIRKTEAERKFNLSKDVLYRICIVKTGNNKYTLIWNFHHIVMDGWCLGLVVSDLFNVYESLLNKTDIRELAQPSPFQFGEYINWLSVQDRAKSLDYWKKYLEGYSAPSSIPAFGNNQNIDYHKGETDIKLASENSKSFTSLCKKYNITESVFFNCVWGVLLSKYSGMNDVAFGMVVSGRPSEIEGVERIVGLFINTIPVRVTIEEKSSFLDVLNRQQNDTIDNKRHQYLSLADVQNTSQLKGNLFDHLVVFENYPVDSMVSDTKKNEENLAVKSIKSYEQTNYNFNVLFVPGDEFIVRFSYNQNEYPVSYIRQIGKDFDYILSQITADPDVLIKNISIRVPDNLNELTGYEEGIKSTLPEKSVIELFEEQVKKKPLRTAVVCGNRKISYYGANRKANRLSHFLTEKGISSKSLVGICTSRSIEMIICMLAVVKSGASYIPVDPEWPQGRINEIVENSGMSLMLSDRDYPFAVETANVCNIQDKKNAAQNPEMKSTKDSLFYAIYTSGSTGKPKGVLIRQEGFLNLVREKQRLFDEGSGKKVSQVAGIGFDAMAFEVWPCILSGGTLFIADNEIRSDAIRMQDWIIRKKINISFQSTVIFDKLVHMHWPRKPALRVMLTAGDRLGRHPDIHIPFDCYNLYGPTEDTVWSTFKLLEKGKTGIPTIGRPVRYHNVYIVDKYGKICPVGVSGEICISGVGVARGYIGRNRETEEKFISNPFDKGTRLYKTGDIGRWLPDGEIEFCGRIDDQIKLYGYRIELNEISSCINALSQVADSVVVKIEKSGNQYLSAYYISAGKINDEDIRKKLQEKLPAYMIPTFFTRLEEFPLTKNGKIDKNKLPDPDEAGKKKEQVMPRNDIDKQLLTVWQEVLQLKNIGITDDFFQIGGNSIKAINVFHRINKLFTITVNDIFELRTIEKLSDSISSKQDNRKLTAISKQKQGKAFAFADLLKYPFGFTYGILSMLKYQLGSMFRLKRKQFSANEYDTVLLTGATGFLGAYLLKDVLDNTKWKVICLVREKNGEKADDRLHESISYYFGSADAELCKNRLSVVAGDITKTDLGLGKERYDKLAGELSAVLHCAANVRHFGDYDDFGRINHYGTENVAGLALQNRNIDFHYISTISTSLGIPKGSLFFSENDIRLNDDVENYYVKSKILAEKTVSKLRKNGVNANIYRVGNVVFDSCNGMFQKNSSDNAFYSAIKNLAAIGVFPDYRKKTIDLSYVDVVARSVISLMAAETGRNRIFHIFNPGKISIREIGRNISQNDDILFMKKKAFFEKLETLSENRDYDIPSVILRMKMMGIFSRISGIFILSRKTKKTVKILNINWPQFNGKLIKRMIY